VSGKFVVRMPPALHADLTARAKEQGVSLNQLVVALLAGGIGFTLEDS
jgi:antitoxin HicB